MAKVAQSRYVQYMYMACNVVCTCVRRRRENSNIVINGHLLTMQSVLSIKSNRSFATPLLCIALIKILQWVELNSEVEFLMLGLSFYVTGMVAWSHDILRGRRMTNQNVNTTRCSSQYSHALSYLSRPILKIIKNPLKTASA